MRGYLLSPEADNDLLEIWNWIARDSVELADRVDSELREVFEGLAGMPGQGHRREDFTSRPVLFFPLYSYLIVYDRSPFFGPVVPAHGRRLRTRFTLRVRWN